MSRRSTIVLLVALAFPVAALAQNPYRLKTGATGKVCLECHLEVQDQMALPFVHSPIRSGECTDCHNPHAASHGKLLATDANSICADCHDEIVPDDAVSVHQIVVDGGCVICHDPHASENPGMLAERGNQLCFSCHEEIAAIVAESEFQHSPARDDCLSCHDPHSSAQADFLLKKDQGELCSECHRTSQPTFVQRHMGYPVAGSRCSACHDPHGSDNGGILLAQVHKPLTNRMCNQCHNEPTAADPLALKKTGVDLCRGCHSDVVNAAGAKNHLHGPMADQTACLNCHSPHASNETGLLYAPQKNLCGTCHQSTIERLDRAEFKHQPVAEGDCSACHAPHAAGNPFLIEAESITALCSECHDWRDHSSHPLGDNISDPRNPNLQVDCQSCHDSHGSSFKAFTHSDPAGKLCVACHEGMRR